VIKILDTKVILIENLIFIVKIMFKDEEIEDATEKAFKFLLILKRQNAICWQRYFEEKMEIRSPEIYQCHSFAFKVTSGNKFEKRFF